MLKLYRNNLSKQEIFLMRHVMEDAKDMLMTAWTECDTYGEKCCEECYARNVCKDLTRLITYLEDVEKSVENVENKKQ